MPGGMKIDGERRRPDQQLTLTRVIDNQSEPARRAEFGWLARVLNVSNR